MGDAVTGEGKIVRAISERLARCKPGKLSGRNRGFQKNVPNQWANPKNGGPNSGFKKGKGKIDRAKRD